MLLLAPGIPPVLAQQTVPAPPPQQGAAAPAAGDRTGRLEQQIADLQAMVAALESLVKTQPSAMLPQEGAEGQSYGEVARLTDRVDALETQIGTLTSQLELLTQQLGAIEAKLSGGPNPQLRQEQHDYVPSERPDGRQGLGSEDPAGTLLADAGGVAGFGAGTDSLGSEDPGEGLEPLPPAAGSQRLAALPSGASAPSLYNRGYGELLRRDYAAAEVSFRALVEHFPDDPLAGKAQYWLGETYYVRGQFKNAADAFLKGYRTYRTGEKAPDSLLKLGMALVELGQKDAACSTLNEFSARFPSADPVLRDEAKSERRRAGCR